MPTDLDEAVLGRDLRVPAGSALPKTPTGDLQTVAGLENVRGALRRRMATTPGTLIHRPDYGAGLEDWVEVAATPGARAQVANRVRRQVLRDARVADARAEATAGLPDGRGEAGLTVRLQYQLRQDTSRPDEVTATVAG